MGRCVGRQSRQHQYRQHQPQRECCWRWLLRRRLLWRGRLGWRCRRSGGGCRRWRCGHLCLCLSHGSRIRILVFILPLPDLPELWALLNGMRLAPAAANQSIDTSGETMRISPIRRGCETRPMGGAAQPRPRAPGSARMPNRFHGELRRKRIKYAAIFDLSDNFAPGP